MTQAERLRLFSENRRSERNEGSRAEWERALVWEAQASVLLSQFDMKSITYTEENTRKALSHFHCVLWSYRSVTCCWTTLSPSSEINDIPWNGEVTVWICFQNRKISFTFKLGLGNNDCWYFTLRLWSFLSHGGLSSIEGTDHLCSGTYHMQKRVLKSKYWRTQYNC